jgi:hypothetical protein
LFATLLQDLYSLPRKTLRLNGTTFGKQRARARVVHLGDRSGIFQFEEEKASAIEMMVRILVSSDRKEQVTEIILNTSEIALVPCLLEVETCGGVFDQCPV